MAKFNKIYVRSYYYDGLDFLRLKSKKKVNIKFIKNNFSYFDDYYPSYSSDYFSADIGGKKEIEKTLRLLKSKGFVLVDFTEDYIYNMITVGVRELSEDGEEWDFTDSITFFVPKKNKLFLKIFNQLIYKGV